LVKALPPIADNLSVTNAEKAQRTNGADVSFGQRSLWFDEETDLPLPAAIAFSTRKREVD
jgi:hypothetical protein